MTIIKKGEVSYYATYGVQNTYSQEKVGTTGPFEAASITKPVFTFVVARLAERGVIDLDKPMCQYLSFQAIEYDDKYKKITARHVLSHTSGFTNWYSDKVELIFELGT